MLGFAGQELVHWKIDPGYPEANLRSLFWPVWYEGTPGPSLVWQSGSGSASSEPKLSLVPLIYGTLKATFYSLLFGVPLALGAALYTSEFMRPALRAKIKPAVEMMASLPSVVLGFLAGAVVAPFVEGSIVTIVCLFFTVPTALVAGAYLWQLLPQRLTLTATRLRVAMMFLMLPIGALLAMASAPWIERTWFAGDIVGWLDGQVGGGVGGWMMLLAPVAALVLGWLTLERIHPSLRRRFSDWPRRAWTLIDLASFIVGLAAVLLISWLGGTALEALGFDPRGQVPATLDGTKFALGIVGTYAPRNALVVGFVMGFAIIPIIYTVADDALSTVPDHLRSASLGAGATPWQTAMRSGGADRDERAVFGSDDRAGPRRRRDDDRADGGRQHSDHGLEHFQRLSDSLIVDCPGNARSGPKQHPLPHAVRGRLDVVRFDVRGQHGRGNDPPALPAEGL